MNRLPAISAALGGLLLSVLLVGGVALSVGLRPDVMTNETRPLDANEVDVEEGARSSSGDPSAEEEIAVADAGPRPRLLRQRRTDRGERRLRSEEEEEEEEHEDVEEEEEHEDRDDEHNEEALATRDEGPPSGGLQRARARSGAARSTHRRSRAS